MVVTKINGDKFLSVLAFRYSNKVRKANTEKGTTKIIIKKQIIDNLKIDLYTLTFISMTLVSFILITIS